MPSALASASSCSNEWPARIAWPCSILTLTSFSQAVALQETVNGGHVEIILVLGRLLRLRLDQDRALEADLVLVIDDHGEEAAHLVQLALEVGVEQGFVAFPAAPEHVVLAAEAFGHVDAAFDRRGGISEDVRIGVGRGTRHVAAVGEEVRRAPEQLQAGFGHLAIEIVGDLVQPVAAFLEARSFRTHVGIMEGVKGDPERGEHLEGDVRLLLRQVHRVAGPVLGKPGPLEGLSAERVAARPNEGVPVADGEAEMILHALAEHDLVGLVEAEGERGSCSPRLHKGSCRYRRKSRCSRVNSFDRGIGGAVAPILVLERRFQRGVGLDGARRLGRGADGKRVGLLGRDQAQSRSAEGRPEVAIGRQVNRQAQDRRNQLQPVIGARAAADRRDAGELRPRPPSAPRGCRARRRLPPSITARVMARRSLSWPRPRKAPRIPASLCGVRSPER
jgi:hypothetical protein